MKKKLLILILIVIAMQKDSYGKVPVGIFMNVADYRNNMVTYKIDSANGKVKIRLHHFFLNLPTVTIIINGKKQTYKKSELYGFVDSDGGVYRFYKNMEYRLAEAGNICIYVQQNNIAQSKGFIVVNTYYFSTAPDADIARLTFDNLKAAYAGNEKFIDLLDQYNGSLSSYDKQNKTFKVNYIFSKASKQ